MKALALLASAILWLGASMSSAQEQEWSRYVPKKDQHRIFGQSRKNTNPVRAVFSLSPLNLSAAYWVTEPLARAAISEIVDRERVPPDEAEARYQELRAGDSYLFLIDTLPYPPEGSELFLQRAENRKVFSKGSFTGRTLELSFGTPARRDVRVIEFPKASRSGQPIVTSLSDQIEIQFTTGRKTVVFRYRIKDAVTKLEDL